MEKLAQKKPNVTVNPDEVVALGAAVQGGVLAGEVRALAVWWWGADVCGQQPGVLRVMESGGNGGPSCLSPC